MEVLTAIVTLFVIGGFSIGAGIWASKRGRSGVGWFFFCFLLSPVVAFILLALLKDLSGASTSDSGPSGLLVPSTSKLPHSPTNALSSAPSAQPSLPTTNVLSEPTDNDFSLALEECLSERRQPGVWARSFTEALGNEARAQALYTGRRVSEIVAERNALELEARQLQAIYEVEELRLTEAGRSILEARAYEAKPKGSCPNCDAILPLDTAVCPHENCEAILDAEGGWRLKPL